MLNKEALVVSVLSLLITLVIVQPAVAQEHELIVPFAEIKSSCYGEIDMSKAEFALSEVGEECVSQDWLEENKPAEAKEESKEEPGLKEAQIKPDNPPKVLTVPRSAVMQERLERLSEDQKEKEKIKISVNWVKDSWLAENRPELALQAVDSLLNTQPTIEEVVKIVNTPRQLSKFMGEYFTVVSIGEIEGRKGYIAFSPSKMLETKRGDCKDWATFSSYILRWNGYKAYKLVRPLNPMDDGHVLTIWKDNKGRYNLLNYTNMYLDIGNKIDQVITFMENNLGDYDEIFAHTLLDPLEPPTLNIRTGIMPKLAEKTLETVPYAKDLDLNLVEKEGYLHWLWGKIMQFEKAGPRKHKITLAIDLEWSFRNPPRKFVLVDIITTSNTYYSQHNPSTEEKEETTFEKAIQLGETPTVAIDEKTINIDSIHPLTTYRIDV